MKRILAVLSLTGLIAITACKSKQSEKSLVLVAFGPADSLTSVNKGFSARVYCFIDMNTDSVLIRDKRIYDSITVVKTGYIKEVGRNKYVKEVMKVLDSLENGVGVGRERTLNEEYPDLYCGWDIFVEYKEGELSKWVYTSRHTIEPFVSLINYSLEQPLLKENHSLHFKDDDLISQIVSREGFVLNYPPVKTIIKFLPPKMDSVKN